ncbi:hypothetical protein HYC85_023621 [Camellia sinensis]|uniref:Uncharacterized protein n=1 Tax=Camellia sinensis TaxID=4442 RepID=A0A7J7GF32_CAMSI|nr:hypothetical protein HYC85_023621 [Camellia sinensis]
MDCEDNNEEKKKHCDNPPAPSPHLTFLPSPANPNPNPNFLYSHLYHHPSSTTTTNSITSLPPPPPLSQPPDLSTTLSTLKHLIHLSETTLHSISTLLSTTATTTALFSWPFNFHHRLPSESLFRYSLKCPSFPSPILNLDPLLLQSLRYPNTLKPSQQLFNQNRFVQTLDDPNSDLCFSLDDYCDFSPNFFYPNGAKLQVLAP